MKRYRRFPLFSLLIVLALVGAVGYLTYLDVDVPSVALKGIGGAVAGLGDAIRGIGGAGLLSPTEGGGGQGQQAADIPQAERPLLVNAKHPLPDAYAPESLVRMEDYCDPDVVKIKGSDIQGNRVAVDALMNMLIAAIDDGLGDWQISAGYRSLGYQQQVWDAQVEEYRAQGLSATDAQTATGKYVARPGTSEHHTGLAFDVTVPGELFPLTEQSAWLAENCWDYGFIIRYTEDKQAITGINAEPWHIRYVGQPHAKNMQLTDQCLEEYLGEL